MVLTCVMDLVCVMVLSRYMVLARVMVSASFLVSAGCWVPQLGPLDFEHYNSCIQSVFDLFISICICVFVTTLISECSVSRAGQ